MWDRLVISVSVRSTEEPVQLFIVLRRPWAPFLVLSAEEENIFVNFDKSVLCTLKASETRSPAKSFGLVQGLPCNVIDASRALSKSFLGTIFIAVLSSQLYNTTAKIEWDWRMRFTRRRAGQPSWLDSYRNQEKCKAASQSEGTTGASRVPPPPTPAPNPTLLQCMSRRALPGSAQAALQFLFIRA